MSVCKYTYFMRNWLHCEALLCIERLLGRKRGERGEMGRERERDGEREGERESEGREVTLL